jgi:hypothetical protein
MRSCGRCARGEKKKWKFVFFQIIFKDMSNSVEWELDNVIKSHELKPMSSSNGKANPGVQCTDYLSQLHPQLATKFFASFQAFSHLIDE